MNSLSYLVTVHTGTVSMAGTDASVSVQLFGSLGNSDKSRLATRKSEMERGSADQYQVLAPFDLGELETVWIGHDNSGFGPGWFLDKVTVTHPVTHELWTFDCQRWLATDEDDGQIERLLPVTSVANKPPVLVGPKCPLYKVEGITRDTGGSFELVSLARYFWDVGVTLQIRFLNGKDEDKKSVAKIASEWMSFMNLKLNFNFDPNYPAASSDNAIKFWDMMEGNSFYGSSSRGPARAGNSSMNLPVGANKGLYLHEFGHALGLAHEQQNRNANIQWDKPAVYAYYAEHNGWDKATVDSQLFEPITDGSANFSDFDSKSVMLYYIPKSFTINGVEYPVNNELSDMDKKGIAQIYPQPPRCTKCHGIGTVFEKQPNVGGNPGPLGYKPVICDLCKGIGHL